MQKVEIKKYGCITMIMWKNLNCELCSTPYPFAVKFENRLFELIPIKPPNPPYAVFEIFSKNEEISIGLYIISFSAKDTLKIVFIFS